MSKLNKRRPLTWPVARHVVATMPVSTGRTAMGGAGFSRDPQSELYLLAITNMVGEQTAHESAPDRDSRFNVLIRHCAVNYPQWTSDMLGWLRHDGGLRAAPVVGAAEFVKARLDAGVDGENENPNAPGLSRYTVDAVLDRPDECADIVNYWITNYGRNLPKPLKAGVGDAVRRMYTAWALLRYDSPIDAVHAPTCSN